MTRDELQILFTALGFLAVVMKGENANKDDAKQAKAMAALIEAFCQAAHPELFDDGAEAAELDRIIEDLKDDELQFSQSATLLADKALLCRVLDRLLQRHHVYATDRMILGEIEHFLEEENSHKNEASDDDRQRSRG
jgi:hypothetical protein